jgi:putative chitinase
MKPDLSLGFTPLILAKCRKYDLLRNQAAYVLATAFWETNRTMKPVVEAYWLSEEWRRKNLRYYPWYGRGFVQLTWEKNYIRAGKILKVDLTTDPRKALDPEISASVLVLGSLDGWFTGKKLGDYITLSRSDYKGARRVVNGTDKAAEIAAIAVDYETALRADGYGTVRAPVAQPAADYVRTAPTTAKPAQGLLARLIALIAAIFNRGRK